MKDKIMYHLTTNSLINESQHGFRPKKSCLTNMLEYLEYVYVTTALDLGRPVDVVYLDFQKAFDKVPHLRLLNKIKAYRITGDVLRWIGEWLKDREQRVVLNGIMSAWIYVVNGVPQESILGPLLFLILISMILIRILLINKICRLYYVIVVKSLV